MYIEDFLKKFQIKKKNVIQIYFHNDFAKNILNLYNYVSQKKKTLKLLVLTLTQHKHTA